MTAVVAAGTADLVPAGVSFSGYPVWLREDGAVSVVEVWEVLFPGWIVAGESSPA
ncbi:MULTISPECIES: hypothetical protein [unclassified Frankia]|uniref:hypothetical protein n=1 Tax=unclassified Frankia TaxID=2632575 RepID=UPI001EF46987|nr:MULTISPECIES: hypothetical protein [unclassified Frankia]